MNLIDMHCDTLMSVFLREGARADLMTVPKGMVDFERMKKGGIMAQFFAIFIVPPESYRHYYDMDPMPEDEYIQGCIELFKYNMNQHQDIIAQAFSAEDVKQNKKNGKMSAVLTMEDGVAVHGKIERIKEFYNMGVRALSLTWNYKNCFGSPNSARKEVMKEGLTTFGKEAVLYMQELGMLVDVSHLSDGGFYDVAKLCKKPFVATHSNCRAICMHQRNLTDDMLKILGEHGGVAGINFAPEFLSQNYKELISKVKYMVDMIEHMRRVAGIDVIGIGSDLDGIDGMLEISDSSKFPLLIHELEKRHFTGREIEKITHANVLRVMEEAL